MDKLQKATSLDYSKYGFKDPEQYIHKSEKGLSKELIEEISEIKQEPDWMKKFRLKALDIFLKKPMPQWGPDLKINFDNIVYFVRPTDKKATEWEQVPDTIRKTFERLGIPEAERKFFAGTGTMYESETIYHKLREDLAKQGVIFTDTDTALKEFPEIFKKYFSTIVPPFDNKFAALNSAVWSGGSFVYIPEGVKLDLPLQAYFRINSKNLGQFERTLIIAEPNSSGQYLEGCSAPVYTNDSLHAAVVEVIAKEGAKIRYTTIQNWSNNVFNLVTKRAYAHKDAIVEWIDGNIGCLTGDTKILTNSNVKNISDVQVGDIVYSLNQNFEIEKQKVVAKKDNEPMDVFRLETSNHREVKATANHPFLVLEKLGTLNYIKWKGLDEIKLGDMIACVGNLPDDGKTYSITFVQKRGEKIKIPTESSKELMWLLGFYTGAGYKDKNRVYFVVSENDKLRQKVIGHVEKLFNINKFEKHGVVIRFDSAAFVDFLAFLGFERKAKEKRIPSWIYTLPKEQKLTFIEGYIDAGRHVRKGHKNISITSVNKELLEDVKVLAIFCGLNPSKISKWSRKEKKPLGKEEKIYEHYFLYFDETKFKTPVYFSKVINVEHIGKEKTYDIEVEGTANFIANGIFAHNSKITMKYPSVFLVGENAKADILSVAFAGRGQHQDAGGKVIHLAPNTSSTIVSKSVSKDGGKTTYRGLVKVASGATGVKTNVRCDALILDEQSVSDTIPYMEINEKKVSIGHEATVGKVNEEQLFYLMSRGLTEREAMSLIVKGFMEPFIKELPMEYAIELNRLIQLEMDGAVG